MPESVHHDPRMNALCEQQSGSGVTKIMDAHRSEFRTFEQRLKFSADIAFVEWSDDRRGEHEVGLYPAPSRKSALRRLAVPMFLERGDRKRRQ